ncbi:CoA transferase [Amycolatopsis sp. NPDC004368]
MTDRDGQLLRVLDLTDDLGLYGARVLVGTGADVVRVDPGPPLGPAAHSHWHAGKRRVPVGGESELDELALGSDVVLESGPLVNLRGLREDGTSRWPHAVHVVVTPFGMNGPRRHWKGDDLVLASAGGMTWLGGKPEGPPKPPPREQAIQLAGANAATAALLGVLARDRTGSGQLIDVSVQEAVAATLDTGAITWIHAGRYPVRNGGVYEHVAHRIFAAADGWVAGGYSGSDRMWTDLLSWMAETGEEADLSEERWADPVTRWQERSHVDEVVQRFMARRLAGDIASEGRARALPWAEVVPPTQLSENPQLRARDFFTRIVGPGLPREGVADIGFPWRSPARPREVSLPDEREPGRGWRSQSHRVRRTPTTTDVSGGALTGLRVLDLTWVLAGPYATKILAEHGADVVKIESRHRQDPTRFAPSMRLRPGAGHDDSGVFLNFNRGKRSVALNLRTREGQRVLRELAPHFDVVVENFSPGVMARWGMDYESLRAMNPGIILVSMAGVGQTGPWRDVATFADTLAAMSGLSFETGDRTGRPEGLTFGLGDMIAANAAVAGGLELLVRGEGGHLDLSQLEAVVAAMGPALLERAWGKDPSSSRPEALQGVYPAAGEDRWVAISTRDERERAALTELAGLPGGECDHQEVAAALSAWTRRQTAEAIADRLQTAGVPAAVVANGRDLLADEHLAARGFYPVLKHPVAGSFHHEGIVARLEDTPGTIAVPAPLLGQHTSEVLREVLGYSDGQLAALGAAGVTE